MKRKTYYYLWVSVVGEREKMKFSERWVNVTKKEFEYVLSEVQKDFNNEPFETDEFEEDFGFMYSHKLKIKINGNWFGLVDTKEYK